MRPPAPAGGPTHYYLALAIGHRAGVGSLTQTFFTCSLPPRAGGVGPGGGVNR